MKILLLFLFVICPLVARTLTKEELTERIEANKATEGDAAAEALAIWQEALDEWKAAEAAVKAEAENRKAIEALGRSEPLQLPAEPPANAERDALAAALKETDRLIAENASRLETIENDTKQASSQVAAAIAEEEKLRAELKALEFTPQGSSEIEKASYQLALLKKPRIEAKLKEIAARKDFIEARTKVAGDLISRAKTDAAELDSLREKLEVRITALKKAEAKETREAIEEFTRAFEKVPEFASIVEELREVRATQDEVEKMLASAKAYHDGITEIGRRIEKQFKAADQRITLLEEAGLGIDGETGVLLRRQRASLPSKDEISAELRSKLELVAKAEIALLEEAERLRNLPVIPADQMSELLQANPGITREAVNDLLQKRQEALSKLVEEYRSLNAELAKGTAVARRTIGDIQKYSNFIDKRLLWIKSARPFSWSEVPEEWGRIVSLISLDRQFLANLSTRLFGESFITVLLSVLVVLGILLRRGKLKDILKTRSEQAVRRNCTSIRPTVEYLGAAFFLSLWLPLLIYACADLAGESKSWHDGLYRLALFLFLSSLLMRFSTPAGLFVNHFRIHTDRAAQVRRNLAWLTSMAPVFVFFVPALTSDESVPESGRLSFILGMLVLAGFCHHLFHPKRSILVKGSGSSGVSKFCYFLILAFPIVFIIGALLGYFESVLTLRDQAGATGGLLTLAFIVVRFLTRWTLVSRRRLAIAQALRRREAAMLAREKGEEGDPDGILPSLEEVKTEAVDVVEVEEQTTKLLKLSVYATVFFGLWGIWESTLPALSILDKVELWRTAPSAVLSDEAATPVLPGLPAVSGTDGGGVEPSKILLDDGRVTLQDLLLTFVFFALTFVAARNIPGLLSLTLFNRIKLGPGGNFALTTTVRYIIVLTGIVLALGQIGITWGKVQWLAAAVSLGIGFGLQEIFANFVAGIILLFERPIRLGDIVTVGNISGSVTEIKIRATTIKQFNNRELLVPNKEFITSQLVNWTLNDSILRLEIQVGIAYGSDTAKARSILEKLLKDHPNIMDDPGPSVFFMGFGASTLDFEARGFVPSADFLMGTKSELHYQIDDAFREAGIEIAFPQQDIHVRSFPQGFVPSKE